MHKWMYLLAASAAFAKTATAPAQPAWDADLFNRNKEVFSSHIEFLYWKAEEGALDYALKMKSPAWSSGTDNYASGTYQRSAFDIDPGFRFSLSYFRAPKFWEVWASYTRVTSRGENHTNKPEAADEYLNGTWPQVLTGDLTSAKTNIHLNYNVADFFVDRFFNPNEHLRIRTLAGIVGAWMNQSWNIYYYDAAHNNTHIQNNWQFGGAGLKIGATADWFWTYDIYLTGKATFGLLFGPYSNRSKQTTNVAPGITQDAAIPLRNTYYSDTRSVTTAQFILGPSYQKAFDWGRLEAFVGYEINAWTNLQEVYRSTSGDAAAAKETWMNSGVLGYQGLTARITTDF